MSQAMVGFVPEPNSGRGTIGILWSCFTTIFLCTYTVLHLDVGLHKSKWKKFSYKIGSMLIAMVVPEMIAYRAITEWRLARRLTKDIRQMEGWSKWTMTQSYFVLMGGVDFKLGPTGFVTRQVTLDDFKNISKSPSIRFEMFPSEEDILNQSKGDTLSKAITTAQVLWFVIQIIARHVAGLTVSLLELSTASFVLFAVVSYLMWMAKPLDVSVKVTIPIPIEERYLWENLSDDFLKDWELQFDSAPMEYLIWSTTVAIFAGIHCAGWNYAFPSIVEAFLWKICCILIFCLPFLGGFIFYFYFDNETSNWTATIAIYLILYFLARLFLIVETLIAFRSCPESIFEKPGWTGYFGHIGS